MSGSDGSSLTVDGKEATIKFTEANLAYANLSGSELTTTSSYGAGATIDFSQADLTHADCEWLGAHCRRL